MSREIASESSIRQQGFTLLELITVLAIIAILILVSYPVYTHHVLKARRMHAEVALLDVASGLERYHALHNTYVGATLANIEVNEYTDNDSYRLDIASVGEANYLLHALPQGAQLEDEACGVLSLNELGEKGVSGMGGVENCW